jgi:hypothetical protein
MILEGKMDISGSALAPETSLYYELLLLLTAIGFSRGGSSPTLVQTKIKIHKTTITTKNYKT